MKKIVALGCLMVMAACTAANPADAPGQAGGVGGNAVTLTDGVRLLVDGAPVDLVDWGNIEPAVNPFLSFSLARGNRTIHQGLSSRALQAKTLKAGQYRVEFGFGAPGSLEEGFTVKDIEQVNMSVFKHLRDPYVGIGALARWRLMARLDTLPPDALTIKQSKGRLVGTFKATLKEGAQIEGHLGGKEDVPTEISVVYDFDRPIVE